MEHSINLEHSQQVGNSNNKEKKNKNPSLCRGFKELNQKTRWNNVHLFIIRVRLDERNNLKTNQCSANERTCKSNPNFVECKSTCSCLKMLPKGIIKFERLCIPSASDCKKRKGIHKLNMYIHHPTTNSCRDNQCEVQPAIENTN